MDPLLHESINRGSVLENMRNAQKNYNDIYSNLDVSLVQPEHTITVGVGVDIGQKDYTADRSLTLNTSERDNSLRISNVAQARVAPDLSDLRSGQDLHNRLQSVSAGLTDIRGNLNQIASQIKPGEDYSRNTLVQEAVGRIYDIIESTTYAGKPVFSALDGREQEVSPLQVRQVPELTEKKYASVQAEIIANAKGVIEDDEGTLLTRNSETFLLTQSNRNKVFSFPESTPLKDIAETISDYTESPVIRPLIYVENQGNGEASVITGEGTGPVAFASDIRVSAIDGELFSRPLDSYTEFARDDADTVSTSLVSSEKSSVTMGEDLGAGRITGTINLARDNVVNGVDVDNMRSSNHSLTRSEQFNQRLQEDRVAGDGFAVTPVDPGGSSGSLTAGSELSEAARSTTYQQNFDASLPGIASAVQPVSEGENLVLDTGSVTIGGVIAPMGGAEAGGGESEYTENGLLQVGDVGLAGQQPGGASVADTGFGGVGSDARIISNSGTDLSMQFDLTGVAGGNMQIGGLESGDNTRGAETGSPIQSASSQVGITGESGNVAESRETVNAVISASTTESEAPGAESRSGNYSQAEVSDTTMLGRSEERERPTAALGANREITGDAENGGKPAGRGLEVGGVSEFLERGGFNFGTNPVDELKSINGIVPQTLQFTLQGDIGEMDYVVAAGVRVDTLSLAINTTAGYTGVTANAVNGQLSLAGFSPLAEVENPATGAAEDTGLNRAATYSRMEGQRAIGSNYSELPVGNSSGTVRAADIGTVGLSDLNQEISLNNLGLVAEFGQSYSVSSFVEQDSVPELRDRPQLARQVLSNAYRYLDTLENNIDSLSSLNERNTYDALERIGGKTLGAGDVGILSAGESEGVLNSITVGINNTVSAGGGEGFGGRPGASLNLLSNITVARMVENSAGYGDLGDTYLQQRLAESHTGFELEAVTGAGESENTEGGIANSPALISAHEYFAQEQEEGAGFARFEESMLLARDRVEDLRIINERRDYRSDNFEESVLRAEERYFANIERAKQTLREIGREYEQELYSENILEDRAVDSMLSQAAVNLAPQPTLERENMEAAVPNPDRESVVEQAAAAVQALQSAVAGNQSGDLSQVSPAVENMTGEDTPPARVAESGAAMDSLTTREPVAVTSSAMRSAPPPSAFTEKRPEAVVKLFEDKIGTVVVHDQGYTLSELASAMPEAMEEEPEVVTSVLDQALEDIDRIRQDIAGLEAEELEYAGDYLLAALESYGSDQIASNPLVIANTTR